MEVVWKDVVGYEDYFMVSEFGDIWSKRSGRTLKVRTTESGYLVFSTKIGGRSGKSKFFRVHRVVAEAFLGKPDDSLIEECGENCYEAVPVNHKNGVKSDNHFSNLEWCNHSTNSRHAVETGLITYKRGQEHHCSVLTDELLIKIISEYVPRSRTNGLRALCRKYGLKHNTVFQALNGVSKYDITGCSSN